MKGYLARLAARSVASDATVRPLAATIFAPAGLEGHAATAWLEQAMEDDGEQAWESPALAGRDTVSGDATAPGSALTSHQGSLPGDPSAVGPELGPPAAFAEPDDGGITGPTRHPKNAHAAEIAPGAAAAVRRGSLVVSGESSDNLDAGDRQLGLSSPTVLPEPPAATVQLLKAKASRAADPAATAAAEPTASSAEPPGEPGRADFTSRRGTPGSEASAVAADSGTPSATAAAVGASPAFAPDMPASSTEMPTWRRTSGPEAEASALAADSGAPSAAVGAPPAFAPDMPGRPSRRRTPSFEAGASAAAAGRPSGGAFPESSRASVEPGLPVPVAAQTRRARRGASATGDTSSPVPTVHVTIGRVEVRAVVAQGAVQRPQPERRPTLTLAEYLQAREAGR
jgi:hypothetical protein